MTQSQVNRAVADATGETVAEVRRRGFTLADPEDVEFDPSPLEGNYLNWDLVDQQRYSPVPC